MRKVHKYWWSVAIPTRGWQTYKFQQADFAGLIKVENNSFEELKGQRFCSGKTQD